MDGEGVGGPDIYVGDYNSSKECARQCAEERYSGNTNITGASYGIGQSRLGQCWCETFMSSIQADSDFQACYLTGK